MKQFITTLFLFSSLVLFGQWGISGVVLDENGGPLPGANVVIENTSTGVSTDFDGNFTINANSGEVLVISYIGYNSEYITVGNQDSITVSLQLDNELEEVVVTALGFAAVRDQQGSN